MLSYADLALTVIYRYLYKAVAVSEYLRIASCFPRHKSHTTRGAWTGHKHRDNRAIVTLPLGMVCWRHMPMRWRIYFDQRLKLEKMNCISSVRTSSRPSHKRYAINVS